MAILTKAAILDADDLVTETVDAPEWGGEVIVRTMTGGERDSFEEAISKANKGGRMDLRGLKVKLVALTVIDEAGDRVFDDADMLELNKKSSGVLDRIFQVAQRLNGLSGEDAKELVGNLDGDLPADSGSV